MGATPVTNTIVRFLRSAAVLGVVTLTSGCVMTLVTDPNAFPVATAGLPALPAGTSVQLANSYSKSYLAKMDHNQQADLHQFTQTAIAVMGRALAEKGVAAGGGKSIVLEVTSPTTVPGFGMARCSVTLNAELGATKVSVFGQAAGMDVNKNFSSAITNAVESLLKDPALREYLSKP